METMRAALNALFKAIKENDVAAVKRVSDGIAALRPALSI